LFYLPLKLAVTSLVATGRFAVTQTLIPPQLLVAGTHLTLPQVVINVTALHLPRLKSRLHRRLRPRLLPNRFVQLSKINHLFSLLQTNASLVAKMVLFVVTMTGITVKV
jgi:hypothetical protein